MAEFLEIVKWALILLIIGSVAAALFWMFASVIMHIRERQAEMDRQRSILPKDAIIERKGKLINMRNYMHPVLDPENPAETPLQAQLRYSQGEQLVRISANTGGEQPMQPQPPQLPHMRIVGGDITPPGETEEIIPLLEERWSDEDDA